MQERRILIMSRIYNSVRCSLDVEKPPMRNIKLAAMTTVIGCMTVLAHAADSVEMVHPNGGSWHPTTLGGAVLATVLFGLAGIFLAIAGFKLFDAFTKFDLEKEICDNRNMAVAVLCGAMLLGICVIVAAAIVG